MKMEVKAPPTGTESSSPGRSPGGRTQAEERRAHAPVNGTGQLCVFTRRCSQQRTEHRGTESPCLETQRRGESLLPRRPFVGPSLREEEDAEHGGTLNGVRLSPLAAASCGRSPDERSRGAAEPRTRRHVLRISGTTTAARDRHMKHERLELRLS
ncbi:unnamed protein product [Pleuronectes platessa]|uniref:Uncharacterized protein n=1 Tax=Pleuronectes platessa TaxID=8262 RepID=A0A9N7U9D0_PLEPL|nr:unnamed protein product [Pleuronectes platessa]